ncbi:hypothetical protein E0H26_24300 [Micromonospora zingiberis]|uniref:Uncharacterized protein n=1 Tax=Micromonospora zingiberis TaxID=2053011 RepID=A0A4R0G899_9ACTN|nr:hypothetical protein [Micromonospora zingiberis]TCB92103.1 hypothetical protein E0H26_24300 [Micromonospora zingiberis]
MDGNIGPVVLGAALTLLGTLAVQAVIVPWAQARTRRRERWEEDIREFADTLEVNLPRLMLDYRTEARGRLTMRAWQRDPTFRADDGFDKMLKLTREDVWKAEDLLQIEMHRISLLPTRLRRLNRNSPYWDAVAKAEQDFSVAYVLANVPVSIDEDMEPDDWDKLWDATEKAHEKLTSLISPMATAMKPPKRSLFRRVMRRISKKAAAKERSLIRVQTE